MLYGKVIIKAILKEPDSLWVKEVIVDGLPDTDKEALLQGALLKVRMDGMQTHISEDEIESIPMHRMVNLSVRFEAAAITPGTLTDLRNLKQFPTKGKVQ